MPGSDIGTGATVTFATSSFVASYTNINWAGISRPAIKTSHLGTTGYDTYVSGDLTDPGEVTFDIQWNPSTLPPVRGAAETVTVRAPVASGYAAADSYAATMFVTDFQFGIPHEDLMTGSITCKVSGTITVTTATT